MTKCGREILRQSNIVVAAVQLPLKISKGKIFPLQIRIFKSTPCVLLVKGLKRTPTAQKYFPSNRDGALPLHSSFNLHSPIRFTIGFPLQPWRGSRL